MPQSLNSKDQTAFRQLVKHYEAKQYKKGKTTNFNRRRSHILSLNISSYQNRGSAPKEKP